MTLCFSKVLFFLLSVLKFVCGKDNRVYGIFWSKTCFLISKTCAVDLSEPVCSIQIILFITVLLLPWLDPFHSDMCLTVQVFDYLYSQFG